MRQRVLRSDLRRISPIREPRVLSVVPPRVWTAGEWERIQLGFRGRDMDDRWHFLVEGRQLFVYRSWLGDGRYEATFGTVGENYVITRVVVEAAEPRFPSRSDLGLCELLEALIVRRLLDPAS